MEDRTINILETKIGPVVVKKGISQGQVEKLAHYAATDPEIIAFTHDRQRFATVDAAKEWAANGKTIYTLTDSNKKLLGIVWFQKMDFPEGNLTEEINKEDYQDTFAIRVYPPSRGKGIARRFMDICFSASGLQRSKVWLSTSYKNEAALSLYRNFGFRQVTTPNEEDRIVMIYDRRSNNDRRSDDGD